MDSQNILVPVDFSPASRFAVNCAVAFARRFRTRLTLLHVVEFPTALEYAFPHEGDKAIQKRHDQAIRLLTSVLGPEDQDDLDLQIRVRHGEVENEIRSAIVDEHASMVVLGTHSRGFVRRLLIGSVTQGILRKLPIPVLTVSQDSQLTDISRILFATDLSESFREDFEFALHLAQWMAAELVIFHAIEPLSVAYSGTNPMTDMEAEKKLLRTDAQNKLAILEAECKRRGVRVRTEWTAGPVAEGILAAADATASELIILTIRRKGVVERALLGSTAERVVREAHVPVLSVPIQTEKVRDPELSEQYVRTFDRSALLFD